MATFRRDINVAEFATVAQVHEAASRVDGVSVNLFEVDEGRVALESADEQAVERAGQELLAIIAGAAASDL